MFNWIGLYLVNELIYQNGTGPMYDVRNTRTLNLGKSDRTVPVPHPRTSA